jgi:hypothetical protein
METSIASRARTWNSCLRRRGSTHCSTRPKWPTTYGRAQGGADTIRARLGEHLAGRQAPGRVKAKLFSFEVTHYPLSRERALLEEYRRNTWRLPEFNTAAPQAIMATNGASAR